MKKLVLSAIIISSCLIANAQNSLTVLYKQGKVKNSVDEYKAAKSELKWAGGFNVNEFIIKDSVTFYETVETIDANDEFNISQYKKTRKTKVLGKNFVPNSIYCDYAKNVCIEEVEWKDESYVVKDNIESRQKTWSLGKEQKLVFGYACNKAELFDENSKLIKIVWYSDNINCTLSYNGDMSVPGVILESYDVATNTVTTAIDVQITTNAMMIPSKGTAISKTEFTKLTKGKR